MAQEQVNIDLIIETAESARNLGELKKSMNEVRGALDKVAVGSKEFGKLNAALDDGAQRLRTFRRGFDGLQAFETFGRTIASSFALASGAIAQFAGDNDELQKSLTRVGSALALLQGFSGLAESMKAAREANLALNASLLTNPYVLVAAGIAAVALALVTSGDEAETAAEKQKEYNDELLTTYERIASLTALSPDEVIAKIGQGADISTLSLVELEKTLSEIETKIKLSNERSQFNYRPFNVDDIISGNNKLKKSNGDLLLSGEAASKAYKEQIKTLKDQAAQIREIIKLKESELGIDKDKTRSQRNEIEDVKNISKYIDLYNDELTNVTKNMDNFLVKQMDVNKVSKDTYNSFRDVATTIQSNSIAYKNLIEGIKDFNPDKQFGGFTKTTQGILFDNLVLKGLMDAQKASINSQFEILNTALFEKPAEFADAAKIIAKKISSEQIQIYTELYQRLIQLGDTPKGAIEKLSGFKFNLTTELTDLNERLVKDFGLSEVAAKNLTNLINGYFKDSIGTVKKFQKDLESGLIIPDDILKVNRDKIKEMEGEYLVLSDVLSHQEDVLKKVGATDKQISEERYNNLIKLKGELEKISEVVSSSILPDDEKSKKTEELTKRINDLRQSLELLGIELGKPKEDNTFVESLNETVNILNALNSVASQTADIFQRASDNRLQTLENEKIKSMAIIDDMYNRRLISDSQYQEKVNVLNEEYRLKEKEEKKQAFEAEKAGKVVSAIINTALAVTSALTAGPIVGFVLAGITAALGAVQVGLIASQPTPEFAQGGFVAGPGGGKEDQIDAKLSNGEYIVNSNATKRFRPLLDQINYGFIGVQNDNGKLNNNNTNNSSNISPINNSDIKVVILQSELEMANKKSKDIKTRVNF